MQEDLSEASSLQLVGTRTTENGDWHVWDLKTLCKGLVNTTPIKTIVIRAFISFLLIMAIRSLPHYIRPSLLNRVSLSMDIYLLQGKHLKSIVQFSTIVMILSTFRYLRVSKTLSTIAFKFVHAENCEILYLFITITNYRRVTEIKTQ